MLSDTNGMMNVNKMRQLPADFLINEDGVIVDLFRAKQMSDHMPFERVEAIIPEEKRCKCNKKDCIVPRCRQSYEAIRREAEAMIFLGSEDGSDVGDSHYSSGHNMSTPGPATTTPQPREQIERKPTGSVVGEPTNIDSNIAMDDGAPNDIAVDNGSSVQAISVDNEISIETDTEPKIKIGNSFEDFLLFIYGEERPVFLAQ